MGNNATKEKSQERTNHAILDYSNGERYNGEVLEGLRNGYGTYYYQNGERYEGKWHKNLKHGRGTFFFKNGEVYEGMWHNNKKEGVGTYYYNNGERYYGEYKDNKKHGKGIVNMEDGVKFIGQFKNNKKSGLGELIRKDGHTTYEEWLDGKLVRQSEKIKYTPGVKYDIDYNQFNTGTFEKYLETKTKQQIDNKTNTIKSKYFTLEFAKMLKSKNPENYYDSVRLMHSTNNIFLEKPDIDQWTIQDVVDVFNKLGFSKFKDQIIENQIDGNKLGKLDLLNLGLLLNITDTNELSNLHKSLEILKKLKIQTENLKSFKNLNSIESKKLNLYSIREKEKDKEIILIEEENNKELEEENAEEGEKDQEKE